VPLPSEKPAHRLEDIIENVQAIQRYTAGMDLAAFGKDDKTRDAVERCLERISEAAVKLGDMATLLMPSQPWRKIRAFGNRLRHEYDSIREDRLWDIVENDLTSLRSTCENALQLLRENKDLNPPPSG
jgi:uncharacterized protein with HEPN domain